jgi:hypothetical protein
MWQAVDRIDYAVFATRLMIVDRLYGPDPATEADRERERERERLKSLGADEDGAKAVPECRH